MFDLSPLRPARGETPRASAIATTGPGAGYEVKAGVWVMGRVTGLLGEIRTKFRTIWRRRRVWMICWPWIWLQFKIDRIIGAVKTIRVSMGFNPRPRGGGDVTIKVKWDTRGDGKR